MTQSGNNLAKSDVDGHKVPDATAGLDILTTHLHGYSFAQLSSILALI